MTTTTMTATGITGIALFTFSMTISVTTALASRHLSWRSFLSPFLSQQQQQQQKPKELETLKQQRRNGLAGDLIVADSERANRKYWKFLSSSSVDCKECEIEVVNELQQPLLCCWVDFDGTLRHFYNVNDCTIKDASVSNRHIEFSATNHVFVLLKKASHQQQQEQEQALPKHVSDIVESQFVCSYRPQQSHCRHVLTVQSPSRTSSTSISPLTVSLDCFESNHRKQPLIDTTTKEYSSQVIHGFTVHCERNVFDDVPTLDACLRKDLLYVDALLPPKAKEMLLQQNTHIYLNNNISYGPQSKPIVGRACCFHPSSGWLERMGMSGKKAGCVEIFRAQDYVSGRELWGCGGLLLHELCHAFHFKCCDQSYDNPAILQAYNKAMERGLYNCVPVHGSQGVNGSVKAYACANAMEFFAELSVAFLWRQVSSVGNENIVIEPTQEYNKWFPHNAKQLLEHDKDSFRVLESIWFNNK